MDAMILFSKKVTPFLAKRVVFVGMNVYCWHVFVQIVHLQLVTTVCCNINGKNGKY